MRIRKTSLKCVHDYKRIQPCYICYQITCCKCWNYCPSSFNGQYLYRCQFCTEYKEMKVRKDLGLGNPVSITFSSPTSCLHTGVHGACFLCRKILCSTTCTTPSESVDELLGYGIKWYCKQCYRKIIFLNEIR